MDRTKKDFRLYKDDIRKQVKKLSDEDKNWNWKVKSVTKNEVKIIWGYLEYLEEKTPWFSIKCVEELESFAVYDSNNEFLNWKLEYTTDLLETINSVAYYAQSHY